MDATETQAYETRDDAGDGDAGLVTLWTDAIEVARKEEDGWRTRADKALERYRDETDDGIGRRSRKFNILYSNTQTLLPALYNATPSPDIRRRFGDADEAGKVAAQVLERAVSYGLDVYDFDGVMRASVFDMVLPGRGIARVKYEPTFGPDDALVDEAAVCEYVDWRDFTRGPGRTWREVPWIAFTHRLTREELTERFGPVGETMPLDVVADGKAKEADRRDVPDVFKRGTVHEIWDKQAREVLFIAPAVKDKPLKRVPDPLRLRDFWPIPRPICDVQDSTSLVPVCPYELYRDQAEELDRVTRRITALIEVCKWRGFGSADVDWASLANKQDGDIVPIQDAMQWMATAGGGLDKAVWLMPIETLVGVIGQLAAHREAIKQNIYEITGLSDILRGASQASETATAQQIKSQWGSLRIQDRQAEVRRFARDLIRLKAEIIAERFQPQTLAAMTGFDEQTVAQVLPILRSDAMRSYRIDIETDSTIEADVARARENAAQFVQGFGAMIQAVGPAVQSGDLPRDVFADLLTAFARTYKLGRQAEDALERLGQQAKQQPAPGAGDDAAAQAAMQAEAMRAQAEQVKAQGEQQRAEADLQRAAADAEAAAMDMEFKREEHRMRMLEMQTKHDITMAELAAKAAMPAPQPAGGV